MAKGRADIANFAVRAFLQEVGSTYDELRGLEPYKKQPHFQAILDYFDGDCCYCGIDCTNRRASEDHLIGLNKTALGLHAWGNVVPACPSCNAKKQGKDWRDYLARACSGQPDKHTQRLDRILAYQKTYKYGPDLNSIRDVVDALYEEVGAIAMKLVELKIARAEDRIRAIHKG